jgi:hypothetical protein
MMAQGKKIDLTIIIVKMTRKNKYTVPITAGFYLPPVSHDTYQKDHDAGESKNDFSDLTDRLLKKKKSVQKRDTISHYECRTK